MVEMKLRTWLGPGLVLMAMLPAGALLETAFGMGRWAWLVRGYMVFALLLMALYLFAVYVPGQRSRNKLARMESEGDLQERALHQMLAHFQHGDLVAALKVGPHLAPTTRSALETSIGSLGGLVEQIQSVSVDIARTANAVRDTAAHLASGSSQQAASVVEITATMEELARTAAQIATNASLQAEMASDSESAGKSGAAAIESAVDGNESVRKRMRVIADRAETLDARSREIYRVLDLINEISQETHILSLNAAIEASTAGEHGERFSVVANEVRRLAERSRESVASVRSLLHEFTTAIQAVVISTEEGSKTADHVAEQSRTTATSIEQLSDALGQTAQVAREISLATQEQQVASQEVLMTVKEESEVISQISDGLVEFQGAADRLNQLALSIQLLSQSFRLESAHSLKHVIARIASDVAPLLGNLEAVENILAKVFKAVPYLEMAYLVDFDGHMMAFSVNRDLVAEAAETGVVAVGQSYADRPWFQTSGREGLTAVTPVYQSLLTGEKCFTVVVPVHANDGPAEAALGVDVNVGNWTKI